MESRRFNTLMKMAAAKASELKQAGQTFFPSMMSAWSSWLMQLPRANYNYAAEIGDGLMSSSVMPAIQWIMRVFPEAHLMVETREGDDWVPVPDHPLLTLLAHPNEWYDGGILWMATAYAYCWFGESYWRIMASRGGRPAELWWLPPWSIYPQWPADGRQFISFYQYQPLEGPGLDLPVEEVVHFRHGIDPRNPRHGLPPLRSILREIWSDEEASSFVASLLRNAAVTSTLITPDAAAGEGALISDQQAELIKSYVTERFTGESRGLPMVLNGPLKVQRLGFAPSELDLSSVRNVAEERVCAGLGVRAAVVGYGTGLEQTRVGATMTEEVGMSWTSGLIPMQRIMGATLAHKLLPLYEDKPEIFRLDWDYRKVRALQEDEQAKATRLNTMLQGGAYRVDEWRTAMGLESEESDRVYLRQSTVVEVPQGEPMTPPMPVIPTLVQRNHAPMTAVKYAWPLITKADQRAILRLADRLEPQMQARFLEAIGQIKGQINQDILEEALRSFDPDLAMASIPWETFREAFGRDATALLREAVGQAGAAAAGALSGDLRISYTFNLVNPTAVQWAEQHAARMVRDISGRTEVAIRELVAQSLRGEWTWQQVARQVRQMVGLTERQALAVQAFEVRLRRDDIPVDRIEARVARYAEAQLRRRGEVIARTEIMTAANQGTQLSWEAAMRDGFLDRQTTYKVWIVTDDERLEPQCEALDGVEVLLHESFPGGLMQPPAHPNCRCTTGLVFHESAIAEQPLAVVAD
jgi:HK97 family phage portal protein